MHRAGEALAACGERAAHGPWRHTRAGLPAVPGNIEPPPVYALKRWTEASPWLHP